MGRVYFCLDCEAEYESSCVCPPEAQGSWTRYLNPMTYVKAFLDSGIAWALRQLCGGSS